jgi:hypothetical protein
MTLKEALEYKGRPFVIKGSDRDDLPSFYKEMGYSVGAEIGVFKGKFTERFCQAGHKMYAIDPWVGYFGAGKTEQKQDKQERNYEYSKNLLSNYDCVVIRESSTDAIRRFKNNSLDFVYIDGNHMFKYIAADIVDWWSKVRPGGVISGHDYINSGPQANNVIIQVKAIVDAYAELYDLDFYITEEIVPSWMFIK